MGFEVTPKSLLLGLVQAAKSQTLPIKMLTEAGELFGYSSNSTRVNVARLLASGVLESDERGFYQLTDKANPVSCHIEDWRKGEKRRGVWKGDWLACLPPSGAGKKKITASAKSLSYFGFSSASLKDQPSPLWIRPNNLKIGRESVEDILRHLGLVEGALLFVASDFDSAVEQQWRELCWPVKDLEKYYRAAIKKIDRSQKRIQQMPIDEALVESFLTGSEVINQLVTDPLLPDELMDPSLRKSLTDKMLRYDDIGQQIWAKKFSDYDVSLAPAHLSIVKTSGLK